MTDTSTAPGARPLAVVTGASTGIGLELARLLVRNGHDLVIAADDAAVSQAAGTLISEGPGADVVPVRVDLRQPQGVELLWQTVVATGRPVEVLALNAGIAAHGEFVATAVEDQLGVVDLNIRSTVHLAGRVLPGMAARGSGKVLITSSIAARMPGPFYATYSASKAFLENFSEGIRNELKGSGVTVTALLPGPTDTEFFERAGMEGTRVDKGHKDSAAEVAKDGFEALMAGRDKVVAGNALNKVMAAGGNVTPDRIAAEQQRLLTGPPDADS